MDTRAPTPKQIFSKGKVADLTITEALPFAGALRELKKTAHDICIGIDLETFFSEVPVELHNFVDSIFYRFMVEGGVPILVYYVATHQGCIYTEVEFDGSVVQTWSDGVDLNTSKDTVASRSARRLYTLGIR